MPRRNHVDTQRKIVTSVPVNCLTFGMLGRDIEKLRLSDPTLTGLELGSPTSTCPCAPLQLSVVPNIHLHFLLDLLYSRTWDPFSRRSGSDN